jgi:hypothetical protein
MGTVIQFLLPMNQRRDLLMFPCLAKSRNLRRRLLSLLPLCLLLTPQQLMARQVRVPLDFTAGYVYNAPGDLVPFRGAVTGSVGFRVVERLMLGPAVGYVVAGSTTAWVAGGQLDVCLAGCFADLEIGIMGRVMHDVAQTPMFPVSAGLVITAMALRSGFVVTRDFDRDDTALELIFGLELLSVPEVIKILFPGGE